MGKLSFASLDWVAQSRHKLPGDCETIPPRSGQNAGANIDSALYLDVRQFKREGLLCAGRSFGWRWTFMDDTSARISVWVKPDQLTLVYSHYLPGKGWPYIFEPVRLPHTDCTCGGTRVWFVCPGCEQRAAKLYYTDRTFRCRRCHPWPYKSQCENELALAQRKVRRLQEKLGATDDPDLPRGSRPKSMHEQTFERLTEDVYEAFWRVDTLFHDTCQRFLARR